MGQSLASIQPRRIIAAMLTDEPESLPNNELDVDPLLFGQGISMLKVKLNRFFWSNLESAIQMLNPAIVIILTFRGFLAYDKCRIQVSNWKQSSNALKYGICAFLG